MRSVRVLLVASTGLSLTLLGIRGSLARWFADDFWTTAAVAIHGFAGAQSWWYEQWSGRFAFTFFMTALQLLGPRVAPWIIPLTIALLGMVLRRFLPLPVALAMTYGIVVATLDVPQSVLWQTGIVTYVFPLVLLVWWVGARANATDLRVHDGIVPFAVAAFSEIGAVCTITFLGILFVVRRTRAVGVALIASVASLTIVALAPGNAVRRALYPNRFPLGTVVAEAIEATALFFWNVFRFAGAPLIVVFLAALLFAPRLPRRVVALAWTFAVVAALAAHAVTFAVLAESPPWRALVVPHAFLVAAIAASGTVVRVDLARWRGGILIVAILACIAGPVIHAVQRAMTIPAAYAFMRRWDALDARLRVIGRRNVVVLRAPGSVGTLLFIAHDPASRMNRAIAETYGLQSIAAAPVIGSGPARDAVRIAF
jgi:hypothetical protein